MPLHPAVPTVVGVTQPATVPPTTTSMSASDGPTPLLTGLVAGALLGILTQIGQGALPDDAAALLANSGGAWLVAAFAVGALMSSTERAAIAGAVTLVVASFTFYEAVDLFEGVGSDHRGALIWAAAGSVAGPVFAVAGFWARRSPGLRPISLALLSGVLIAEAMHLLWWVGIDTLHGVAVVELLIGAGVLAVAVRLAGLRRWPEVVGVAAAAWLAARLATEAVDLVFSRV